MDFLRWCSFLSCPKNNFVSTNTTGSSKGDENGTKPCSRDIPWPQWELEMDQLYHATLEHHWPSLPLSLITEHKQVLRKPGTMGRRYLLPIEIYRMQAFPFTHLQNVGVSLFCGDPITRKCFCWFYSRDGFLQSFFHILNFFNLRSSAWHRGLYNGQDKHYSIKQNYSVELWNILSLPGGSERDNRNENLN